MKKILALVSVLALSVASIKASTVVLDFESATIGSDVNPFLPTGVSIAPVQYAPVLDSFGDPTGAYSWQADTGIISVAGAITYGGAYTVTGNKALDTVFGPACIQFTTPGGLDSFSLLSGKTLDSIGNSDVLFLDAAGNQVADLSFNQSSTSTASIALGGLSVASIVLPSGSLYDNITYVTSAPEPGRVSLLGLGLIAAVLRRRRC